MHGEKVNSISGRLTVLHEVGIVRLQVAWSDVALVAINAQVCKLNLKQECDRQPTDLPTWRLLYLQLEAVPARILTTKSFLPLFITTPFPVSSSCLQLGMLNGCCFRTLDRSRSRVS